MNHNINQVEKDKNQQVSINGLSSSSFSRKLKGAKIAVAAAGALAVGSWAKDELTEHSLPGMSFLDPVLAPMKSEHRSWLEDNGHEIVRVGPYNFAKTHSGLARINPNGTFSSGYEEVHWLPEADLVIASNEGRDYFKQSVIDEWGTPLFWYDSISWSDELKCAVGEYEGELYLLESETGQQLHDSGYVEIKLDGKRYIGREK